MGHNVRGSNGQVFNHKIPNKKTKDNFDGLAIKGVTIHNGDQIKCIKEFATLNIGDIVEVTGFNTLTITIDRANSIKVPHGIFLNHFEVILD